MKKIMILSFVTAFFVFSKGEEDVITKYLNALKVGEPIEYRNLTIFPLLVNKTFTWQDYVTLDEAMDKGWLKIKEAGSGEVNFVEVKNSGKKMVFMMTGEMVRGAKQDRMLKEDVLLPSNSGWVRVPVYCVEHGRWTSVSSEFKSGKLLVPNSVREKAKMNESQSDVWDEIATSQDRLGIASGTGTVRANYEDESVNKEIAEYTGKFKKVPQLSKSTIGVVVVTGNRIICFDLFANNGLLNKLWDKLIKSYAMDALSGEKGTVHKHDIEDFIEALKETEYISTGTPGIGKLIKIESEFGKGAALVYSSSVVHMDFFPTNDCWHQDSGMRLDFRMNERLEE
jgi:hypothetical protein